jgi:hypothetical protein
MYWGHTGAAQLSVGRKVREGDKNVSRKGKVEGCEGEGECESFAVISRRWSRRRQWARGDEE